MTFDELGKPILEAVNEGGLRPNGMDGEELMQRLNERGVEPTPVELKECLFALREDAFIKVSFGWAGVDLAAMMGIKLDTRGRQLVANWPGPLSEAAKFEALIAALIEASKDSQIPEGDQSKLKQAAGVLRDVGSDVAGTVIGTYLTRL